MPCIKRVYRDQKASFHCSATRNKYEKNLLKELGVGTLVSSLGSTAGFVPSSILSTNQIVSAFEETLRTVFLIRWSVTECCLVTASTQRRPVLPTLVLSRRPAVRRLDWIGP